MCLCVQTVEQLGINREEKRVGRKRHLGNNLRRLSRLGSNECFLKFCALVPKVGLQFFFFPLAEWSFALRTRFSSP